MRDAKIVSEKVLDHQVQLFDGKGFRFVHHNPAPNPTGKGGAKRGAISTWSFASRRRLRKALMCLRPKDKSWRTVGFTLTVPGSVLPVEEAKTLWEDFSRTVQKQGFAMIWRLELQERGQLHWHGLAFLPPGCGEYFAIIWKNSIVDLGPDVHVDGKGNPHQVYNRMELRGARDHAVDIQTGENADKVQWLRYLQDHASKQKQAQVAENCGRHWGVVGKKYLEEIPADHTERLSDDDFHAVLRVASKWSRRRLKSDCVFGCKLSKRTKRGRFGASDWFEGQGVMPRVLAWMGQIRKDREHLTDTYGEPIDF